MFYVGFVGDHGTGKSTFADNLEQLLRKHGEVRVLRVNMADSLRGMLAHTLPVEPDLSTKRHPLERPTLQHVGEAWRLLDKNYWIQDFFDDVQRRVDMLPEDADGGTATPVVVLVADTYNLNELPLMDQVIMLRRPDNYDTGELYPKIETRRLHDGYVAETVRGTQWALHHPYDLADIVDGTVLVFQGDTPADIGRDQHLTFAANRIVAEVHAKLVALGLPIPFVAHDPIVFAEASEDTDCIDTSMDLWRLTHTHWRRLEDQPQIPQPVAS